MFTPGNFPGGLQSHPHRTSPQPGSATSSNNPPTGNNQVELPLQAWPGHLHLGSGGLLLVTLLALAGTQEAELFISAAATPKENRKEGRKRLIRRTAVPIHRGAELVLSVHSR